MASVSLKDILSHLSLCGMVQTNVPTLPRRLPEKFYNMTPVKVEGDSGRYTRFTSARQPMRMIPYYAPSVARDLRPIGQFDVKLFHGHENLTLNAHVLEAMRNFNDYNLQEKGKDWVAKQMNEAKYYIENAEDLTALFVLTKGKVWRDGNGNLLPTSSGAVETSDFGINQSTNVGTIAALTSISGSWASPATQIPLQLEQMRIKAQGQHGYIPKIILYGKNIPTMLAANDFIQPLLPHSNEKRESFLEGKFPSPTYNLLGYEWYPISDAGFNNTSGVYQFPMDDNALVFMPDPDESWWQKMEGSYAVPTNINVLSDLEGSINAWDKIYGRFAYSKLVDDPVRMIAHYGNTWGWVITNPDVVYQATAA